MLIKDTEESSQRLGCSERIICCRVFWLISDKILKRVAKFPHFNFFNGEFPLLFFLAHIKLCKYIYLDIEQMQKFDNTQTAVTALSYLSHHPIPDIVDLLAMLAIGYQVQVIGEPHVLCNLFQNVDAEAFAALLDVRPTSLSCVAAETQRDAV